MLKTNTESVKGYKEMNIPYTLLRAEENSKNLSIFLPGAGYTVRSPLFHYSGDIFLNNGFDVLQVNYQYNDKAYAEFSMEEISEAIKFDVRTVLDIFLKDTSYENFYIIGKSLGTIAMSSELCRDIFREAKAVWLTPLIQRDDVFDAMVSSNNRGLCFIGDNDSYYIEKRFNQIAINPEIVSRLIPNVNHSLEYENNTIESIEVLKSVIEDIRNF
ncbi:alpha/beta hydrolase [Sporosarcina sp. ANT_H38]|uniref:alpha/beta hydrolase n=1 Tax=Sporosarcina sp. ANT_H38 TaxID=2597358 RepID=UPI0011F119D7|nr:alpha/beta hydrolase [Sporosarcina sp. ANT_H38]KAA0966230.1 alpha/beta hydrolase [Sporosarcina sp. ANT_H38]